MKTRTAESVVQPSATANITMNDHMTSVKNDPRTSRHGDARNAQNRQQPYDDRDECKTTDHDENSHPAWNPDSRWSA